MQEINIMCASDSQTQYMENTDTQAQNRQVALDTAEAGFRVFPVKVSRNPANPKKKRAKVLVKSWKDGATTDPDQINAWWDEYPDAVPGMPTGKVFVVDLDVDDGKDGEAEFYGLGLDPEDALFAVRTPSGGRHLYYDGADGLTITQGTETKGIANGIDTRGHGGFVFAPGARTIFGEYQIERGELFDLKHGLLTDLPEVIRAALKKPKTEPAENQLHPGLHTFAELAYPLSWIPNDGPHENWVRILMAVHHATSGSKGGLALVQAWSADYPGYDPKEVINKWRGFGKYKGAQITAETLFADACKHGWQRPLEWNDDDLDEDELPSGDCLLSDDTALPVDTGGLTFLTPDQCANLPARDYVVKRLIAPGQIGCIFGEPGAGKSLIAPWLAYGVAQGENVFGLRTKQGSVFYVACEDEDGMAGRVAALRTDLGTADDFHLVRGCSDLFSHGQIEGKGSPDLVALFKQVKVIRPKLVVIDTLAMAMPGLEENDSAGMDRVVQIGKRLAKYGAAVVFVHHGTKAEGNTPRGHSRFNGALDFSIMVTKADKSGIVRGTIKKNRNGPPELDIAFKIGTRRVGTDVDGEPVDAPICLPCDPGQTGNEPKLTPAETAALALVLEMSESEPVDETKWRKAATDGFAISGSEKRDSRHKAVARALSALVQKGQIEIEGGLIRIPSSVEGADWDDDLEKLLS